MKQKTREEKPGCPNCGCHTPARTVTKAAPRAVLSGELPIPFESHVIYKCYTCGYEFEDNG